MCELRRDAHLFTRLLQFSIIIIVALVWLNQSIIIAITVIVIGVVMESEAE